MDPTPLIPKAPRVRLSEEAKAKLRTVIHEKPCFESGEPQKTNESNIPEVKSEKRSNVVKPKRGSKKDVIKQPLFTNCSQPLVLATASEWIRDLPGRVIGDRVCNSGVF